MKKVFMNLVGVRWGACDGPLEEAGAMLVYGGARDLTPTLAFEAEGTPDRRLTRCRVREGALFSTRSIGAVCPPQKGSCI
jgi:hypothetical protein